MVSVIMPVYNAEKYLDSAVNSVLSQTYKDFELICVDDGSTDRSLQILNNLARNDNRIAVIHQANNGICAARNAGLKRANGEYVAFIDCDDLYMENLLEDNYAIAKKYHADIVHFGAFFPQSEEMVGSEIKKELVDESSLVRYTISDILKEYSSFRPKYLANVWNGLYKRELIEKNDIKFNVFYKFSFEDWMFNIETLFKCHVFVFNPARYYVHFVRINYSVSQKWNLNRLESYVDGKNKEISLCKNAELDETTTASVVAYYIMIISRDVWGKPNGWNYTKRKTFMEKLHWDKDLGELKIHTGGGIKQYILAKLYQHKQWLLQLLFVKLWKLKCKREGSFF